MTTKIHVVNFGPQTVEVEKSNDTIPVVIYPQESQNFYVCDGQDVTIKEVKQKPEIKD